MAWYPKAVRKELPANDRQGSISPRTIAQHTAVSNGSSLYTFFNGRSSGVESHFYLQKDGGLEQYVSTTVRADCQNDANSFAVSIETWDGYPHGWANGSDVPAFTSAQVESLAELYAWLHKTHGIPLRISRYWNDSGVGWHRKYIGDPGWARSARACPGDRRIAQIPGIIALAQKIVDGPEPEPPKDWFDMADKEALREVVDASLDAKLGPAVEAAIEAKRPRIAGSVLNTDFPTGVEHLDSKAGGGGRHISWFLRDLRNKLYATAEAVEKLTKAELERAAVGSAEREEMFAAVTDLRAILDDVHAADAAVVDETQS